MPDPRSPDTSGASSSGAYSAPSEDAPPAGERSAAWYRQQWRELGDILQTSDPEDVVAAVRELQLDALQEQADVIEKAGLAEAGEAAKVLHRLHDRLGTQRQENQALRAALVEGRLSDDLPPAVRPAAEALQRIRELLDADALPTAADALARERAALDEFGLARAQQAVRMIRSMEEQLDGLYQEKEAIDEAEDLFEGDGDTFEQLQALMAREERLRRELGVSSSEEVVEMVQGLATQLDELYGAQDSATMFDPEELAGDGTQLDTFEQLQRLLEREDELQRELGVSDPEEVVEMVRGLADQLDELYAARERLSRASLDDADSVVAMINSMQQQLEGLYASQEQLSQRGIGSIEQAIAMIESMETQLGELYEEKKRLVDEGLGDVDEAVARIRELEERMEALAREKQALQSRRALLRSQEGDPDASTVAALEDELGTSDPATLVKLVTSMEAQLIDVYQKREDAERAVSTRTAPLDADEDGGRGLVLPRDVLPRLDAMDDDALDAFDAGIVALNDLGVVEHINAAALQLPSLDPDTPRDDLVGRNFFFELVPGTHNALFRGRFLQHQGDEAMDERFPYTLVSRQAPPRNYAVHLYRRDADGLNWVLFRPL